MKKETQIHATIETIEILPNFSFTGGTIEEVKEQAKQGLKARFDGLGFDNINITNVEVFEIEERISTEDLIAALKCCIDGNCDKCPIECMDIDLQAVTVDRLEELYNQQKATPTEQKRRCTNCKYQYEPLGVYCLSCKSNLSNWEAK